MKISRQFFIFLLTTFVFALALFQGFSLAFKKPLWNDEIYTQISSVEIESWQGIWTGGIREGNNSPVFYSIQKIICSLFHYQSDDLWHKEDIDSRFILRIAPVVYMSLGLALLVGFFCIFYSYLGGLIVFALSITSYMVWYYWAEARPYSLIFLATVIQSLVLLYYYRFAPRANCWGIGAVNLLLALTSSLSVIQITASAGVLWFKGDRKLLSLLGCVAMPMAIAIFYYMRADHYAFYFASYGQPLNLICSNIPSGRLAAFFIIPVLMWLWDWFYNKNKTLDLWVFFVWGWMTFLGYVMFLGYLFYHQKPNAGFEVSGRYLMTLTPLGIVIVAVAILEFARRLKLIWGQMIFWIVIALIILPRFPKVLHWMKGL